MTQYAIVRVLNQRTPKWSRFWVRWLAHEKTVRKNSTMRCSEIPSIKTFNAFLIYAKLGDITLGNFDSEKAEDFKIYLSSRYKQNTVRHKLVLIKSAFEYAKAKEIIAGNPFSSVEIPQSVYGGRNLTDKELRMFLNALPITHRRACTLMLWTGLRRSELLNLKWSQVHRDYIEVLALQAKSKRGRIIPLHPRARLLLGPKPRTDVRVFPFSVHSFSRRVTRTWRRLGMGRIRIHDMRHVWATRYMERTGDIYGLLSTGGWASFQSARPYRHLSPARALSNIKRLTYRL